MPHIYFPTWSGDRNRGQRFWKLSDGCNAHSHAFSHFSEIGDRRRAKIAAQRLINVAFPQDFPAAVYPDRLDIEPALTAGAAGRLAEDFVA